jgi:hypothetical protein
MTFVTLTDTAGQNILINLEQVASMQWIADTTHILVAVPGRDGRPFLYSVKETPDQILMSAKASPMSRQPQIG